MKRVREHGIAVFIFGIFAFLGIAYAVAPVGTISSQRDRGYLAYSTNHRNDWGGGADVTGKLESLIFNAYTANGRVTGTEFGLYTTGGRVTNAGFSGYTTHRRLTVAEFAAYTSIDRAGGGLDTAAFTAYTSIDRVTLATFSGYTASNRNWGGIGGTLADQTDLQNALNAKQNSITGGATTITGSDLTASRALVSNTLGKVAVSSVTSTELSYLSGVTSGLQAQLTGKVGTSQSFGGDVSGTYNAIVVANDSHDHTSSTIPTNSFSAAGLVPAGAGSASKVWKTDGSGIPAWRDDATGSSPTFDAVGGGTNTTSTMTVGTGGTLTYSGSGVLNASKYKGQDGPSATEFAYLSDLESAILEVNDVVNNLTAGGTAVPLSAEQGKNLNTAFVNYTTLDRPTSAEVAAGYVGKTPYGAYTSNTNRDITRLRDNLSYRVVPYKSNPIISGAFGSYSGHRRDPSRVQKIDSTYWMWYTLLSNTVANSFDVQNASIAVASAPYLVGPWTEQGIVLSKGVAGKFDDEGVLTPDVVIKGSVGYLFYTGFTGSYNGGIGVASFDIAGPTGTYTRLNSGNPVIAVGSVGTWKSAVVDSSYVTQRADTTWRLDFKGRTSGEDRSYGFATTSDASFPLGWSEYAGNPYFGMGVNGSYAGQVEDPSVLFTEDGDFCYLSAQTSANPSWYDWWESENCINGWRPSNIFQPISAEELAGTWASAENMGYHTAPLEGRMSYIVSGGRTDSTKDGIGLYLLEQTSGQAPTYLGTFEDTGLDASNTGGTITVHKSGYAYAVDASDFGGTGSSQWTTTGDDIYYNTGKVGIGDATPEEKAHISGGNLKIDNVGNTSVNPGIVLKHDSATFSSTYNAGAVGNPNLIANWTLAGAQSDATKPSWGIGLRVGGTGAPDTAAFTRAPAGSNTMADMMKVDADGKVTAAYFCASGSACSEKIETDGKVKTPVITDGTNETTPAKIKNYTAPTITEIAPAGTIAATDDVIIITSGASNTTPLPSYSGLPSGHIKQILNKSGNTQTIGVYSGEKADFSTNGTYTLPSGKTLTVKYLVGNSYSTSWWNLGDGNDGGSTPTAIITNDTNVTTTDTGDGYISFVEDNGEQMRLTGNKVGIGTTAPILTATVADAGSTAPATRGIAKVGVWDGANFDIFAFKRARGSVVTSPSALNSGDNLGAIDFQGYVGTTNTYQNSARIGAGTEAASTGDNAYGPAGYLTFDTGSGAALPTPKLRITSTGRLRITNQEAAPANNATCTVGDTILDAANGFLYLCTSTNSWKRASFAAY